MYIIPCTLCMQYAALASKVTMTSEIEHDIAGDSWPSAHNLPPEQAAQTSAADAAAAAAASAALSAAQARIEELLDDKADLEYEIDVVERKVELLREEVSVHVRLQHNEATTLHLHYLPLYLDHSA